MFLWHQILINKLNYEYLIEIHRTCCALRGRGWGRPHATVNYVFNYPIESLIAYHRIVMREMIMRSYQPDPKWFNPQYRGEALGLDASINNDLVTDIFYAARDREIIIYNEHNEAYFNECVALLEGKKAPVNLAGVYWKEAHYFGKENMK